MGHLFHFLFYSGAFLCGEQCSPCVLLWPDKLHCEQRFQRYRQNKNSYHSDYFHQMKNLSSVFMASVAFKWQQVCSVPQIHLSWGTNQPPDRSLRKMAVCTRKPRRIEQRCRARSEFQNSSCRWSWTSGRQAGGAAVVWPTLTFHCLTFRRPICWFRWTSVTCNVCARTHTHTNALMVTERRKKGRPPVRGIMADLCSLATAGRLWAGGGEERAGVETLLSAAASSWGATGCHLLLLLLHFPNVSTCVQWTSLKSLYLFGFAPCISVCLQLYKQTLCDIKTKQKKGIPIFPRQVVPPPSETSSQLLVRKTKASVLAISESLHTYG